MGLGGKIPYYTMPPVRNREEPSEAKIVSEFDKEFNIDEVYTSESSFIRSLKSADDFNPVEVPSSGPLNFDESMLELEEAHAELSNLGAIPENTAGDVDESMEYEDDVSKNRGKTNTSRQNEKLYAAEGILNTKLRRAEKKRRKKANKTTSDAMDDDYGFKVDYFQKGTAMDADDSEDERNGDDDPVNSEVPMSGIQVDGGVA